MVIKEIKIERSVGEREFLRFLIKVVVPTIVTISIIIVYMFRDKIKLDQTVPTFNLNKIDKLLSENERRSLIQQIVKESLKQLLINKKKQNDQKIYNVKNNISILNDSDPINNINIQRLFHKGKTFDGNHSIRNSNLKEFEIQTTIEERNMMYMLLETFDNVLKKNNITYFMYGGTLLGSFRHHDIIPWDDDIDVIVSAKDYQRIISVFSLLSPKYTIFRANKHDKFFHKDGKKSSLFPWLWPYVDISYYEENNTHINDWVITYNSWYYYPKEIIFPLHNRPLLNLSLPAPRDTFAFLCWTYQYNSSCIMEGYSHMVEGAGPYGKTDCKNLAEKFPFVEHLPDENGIREILKYKELEIKNIVINEPKYAVAETFKLSLKKGFSMPSKIKPPS